MSFALDLTSARAKLKRAKEHIKTLRTKIGVTGESNTVEIPLRQQFEAERSAVVWRIESVIEVRDDWGLIVGDAAHNLRCALDHLAWQLALRNFNGIEPTDRRIIKQIQFPVVMNKGDWPAHINRKHMEPADAHKLERFQPFNMTPDQIARGGLHILEHLAGFGGIDNVDKHRAVHLTSLAWWQGTVGGGGVINFTDCWFIGDMPHWNLVSPSNPPSPDNEILSIIVTPTGPNPYVDFKASLTGAILVREMWNVLDALDAMTEGVANILGEFS